MKYRGYNRLFLHINERLKNGDKIIVTAIMGSVEAFGFAEEILNYLKQQGYDANGVNQAIYAQPVRGQILNRSETDPNKVEIIIGGNGG